MFTVTDSNLNKIKVRADKMEVGDNGCLKFYKGIYQCILTEAFNKGAWLTVVKDLEEELKGNAIRV